MGKLYTVDELAPIWGVHPQSIWRWIRQKRIAVVTMGREYRIDEATVKNGVPPRRRKKSETRAKSGKVNLRKPAQNL